MPRTPYFPPGTLREVLAYPKPTSAFESKACSDALARVGLERLTRSSIHAERWDRDLNEDELHALALARVMTHKAAWVLIDEVLDSLEDSWSGARYRHFRQGSCTIGHYLHRPQRRTPCLLQGFALDHGSHRQEAEKPAARPAAPAARARPGDEPDAMKKRSLGPADLAALPDEELLEAVQRQTFGFFWEAAHPVSGLAPDRCTTIADTRR